MSTSLLYHAQDLKGIRYSRAEFKEGRTVFHAVVANGCHRCSKRGSRRVVQSGGVYREFKLVPTGTRKNHLRLYIPRLVCRECGVARQVDLSFADRRKGYTRSLARYVLSLCRLLPLKTVAELCGLSWNTVKEIHKAGLRRKHRRSKFGGVRIIAVDEVCVGRPRKYLTLVIDLDEALRCNEPLHIAYYLKEELASLWSLGSKAEAEEHLENWLFKAANSGVGMLKKVSKWLGRVKDKILNWFDCPISSGKLEAFNGQIRRLLKNTCGLRDQEYLFLRIQDLVDAKL